MANEIKKINVGGTEYSVVDEYARQRIEGLATIYSISCDTSYTSSYTYVDYDTEADVAFSSMTVMNSKFKSTAKDITISSTDVTTETSAYIVLLITKSANKYYVKKLTNLTLGDTVYVKEDASVCADRWLSSWTESPLSGTFTALDAKIDLSNYPTKSVAGKAGTYTTSNSSITATGSAGEHIATGTATITYKKADSATGSAGAGESANTGAGGEVSIAYTPSGSISGTQSIGAHSHVVNLAKATVSYVDSVDANTGNAGAHTHSVSGKVTAAGSISVGSSTVKNYTPSGSINVVIDAHNFTPEGSVSGTAVGDHTYAPAGTISAVSAASHSHSVSASTDSFTAVTSITGFSGGSLNAATAKSVVTGVTAATLTGDTSFVKSISNWNGGTFTQGSKASLGYTATAGYGCSSSYAGGQQNVMYGPTVNSSGVLSWSTLTMPVITTALSKINSWSANGTDSFTAATCTIAGGSVSISGGVASGSISVVPSYTLTPASLGTQNTGSITYVTSVGANTGLNGAINVTPTFSGTTVTLSHSVTDPTFVGSSVSLSHNVSTKSFSGTGVDLKFTGSAVDLANGLAASAGGHSHSIGSSSATFSNVTGATLNANGSTTVDFSKATFTGSSVTLSQASHTHSYTKPTAHTHSIGLTDTSATGTAAVNVANHTHSMGHTHTVTVPNCN